MKSFFSLLFVLGFLFCNGQASDSIISASYLGPETSFADFLHRIHTIHPMQLVQIKPT